mmetsp:Transcript_7202/g.8341  ORF Transcript_7202/g.8341 Transcript_7202/m.8341 type:complete len:106 (-) Transcript_7202:191-508(-)
MEYTSKPMHTQQQQQQQHSNYPNSNGNQTGNDNGNNGKTILSFIAGALACGICCQPNDWCWDPCGPHGILHHCWPFRGPHPPLGIPPHLPGMPHFDIPPFLNPFR